MNIYKKLQEVRTRLQELPIKKSGYNRFSEYKYFEMTDFMPDVKKLFNELGLCATLNFKNDPAELIITNIEKPEESLTFYCPIKDVSLKGCHPVQNLGAQITYITRYLWVMALEINESDILDSQPNAESKPRVKKEINPLQPKIDELKQLSSEEPVNLEQIVTVWRSLDSAKQKIVWKMLNSNEQAVIRHATQG